MNRMVRIVSSFGIGCKDAYSRIIWKFVTHQDFSESSILFCIGS
jgi:hypothetical protein